MTIRSEIIDSIASMSISSGSPSRPLTADSTITICSSSSSLNLAESMDICSLRPHLNVFQIDKVVAVLLEAIQHENQNLLDDIDYIRNCIEAENEYENEASQFHPPSMQEVRQLEIKIRTIVKEQSTKTNNELLVKRLPSSRTFPSRRLKPVDKPVHGSNTIKVNSKNGAPQSDIAIFDSDSDNDESHDKYARRKCRKGVEQSSLTPSPPRSTTISRQNRSRPKHFASKPGTGYQETIHSITIPTKIAPATSEVVRSQHRPNSAQRFRDRVKAMRTTSSNTVNRSRYAD